MFELEKASASNTKCRNTNIHTNKKGPKSKKGKAVRALLVLLGLGCSSSSSRRVKTPMYLNISYNVCEHDLGEVPFCHSSSLGPII